MKKTITVMCGAMIAGVVAMAAFAGDLNPPPGTVSPTAKPLQEIEPRIGLRSVSGFLGPITIDEPGSYYLLENIQALANFDGIVITASDVTIDLNGFAIFDNPAQDTTAGIRIGTNDSPVERVTIKNGSISGFDDTGIIGPFASAVIIDSVRVTDCGSGIVVRNGSQVHRSVSNNNDVWGIQVSFGSLAAGCTARGNGSDGMQAFQSIIRDSTSSNNSRGFFVSQGGVVECVAYGNASTGFTATSDSHINGCTAIASPTRFSLSSSSSIVDSND